MNPALADSPLLFQWQPPRRRVRALVTFLIVSILLHAVGFYVFQIVYPPGAALLPPPARLNIITPNTEDGRVLLSWVNAEDPALALTTRQPPSSQPTLPRVEHVPSLANYEPALKPIPLTSPKAEIRALPPAPVPVSRAPSTLPLQPVASRVVFSEKLVARLSLPADVRQLSRSNNEAPQPTHLLIAVNASGIVQHSFVTQPSGDALLDEEARAALGRSRFAPGESSELTWGTAVIEWGNDVVHAAKASPATRAP